MKDLGGQFGPERTGLSPGTDHILVASIVFLTGLGLVTLYSSSYAFGQRFFGDGYYFMYRQLQLGAVGALFFLLGSRIDLEIPRRFIGPLVIGTVLISVLPFVPGIGVVKNDAARWFRIGSLTYQPSEMVKLVLPFYLAHILDKKRHDLDVFFRGILPPVMVTALFFLLICLQNNFSTAIFIALNALLMFFLAGIRLRYFFGAAAILVPLSSFLVLTRPHRLLRVISFFNPEGDPQGIGYQIRASLRTIAAGGFWGKGIGQGTFKVASVPEIHSDFIFSSFAEESGFLGILLFSLLFGIFAIRGYRAALRVGDCFRRLLAAGFVTMISSQALLNIAVVGKVLPTTGVPLPFFSAGGSSLLTTLAIAGIIVNISRNPDGGLSSKERPQAGWPEGRYVR